MSSSRSSAMAFNASFSSSLAPPPPPFSSASASASASVSQLTHFSSSCVSWFSCGPNCTHARLRGKRRREGTRKVLMAAQNDQSGSGDFESKQVLDAFFLGKAFADTVNERLGNVVGEFLSEVGRKQAENQKEVRKFQDEVQERARLAKIKVSRQALSKEDIKATKNSRVPPVESIRSGESLSRINPPSAPEQQQELYNFGRKCFCFITDWKNGFAIKKVKTHVFQQCQEGICSSYVCVGAAFEQCQVQC